MRRVVIAIVGSRGYRDLVGVRAYVRQLYEQLLGKGLHLVILSGGAKGVDRAAVAAAHEVGAGWEVRRPDRFGGKPFWVAAFERNSEIVEECHHLVAFWDGFSNGTEDTIEKARAAGKLRRVFNEDEEG